jgi:hypothetical protein
MARGGGSEGVRGGRAEGGVGPSRNPNHTLFSVAVDLPISPLPGSRGTARPLAKVGWGADGSKSRSHHGPSDRRLSGASAARGLWRRPQRVKGRRSDLGGPNCRQVPVRGAIRPPRQRTNPPNGELEPPGAAGVASVSYRADLVWPARPWPDRLHPAVEGRCWCPSRLLGASGCNRRRAWWRMPTIGGACRRAHAASGHVGPGTPARCRASMLLKVMGHQQLIASSWALRAQLGRALPRPVPWAVSPGTVRGDRKQQRYAVFMRDRPRNGRGDGANLCEFKN